MNTDRPDKLFREFLENGKALEKHVLAGIKALELGKKRAYRMAVSFVALSDQHGDWLRQQIITSGIGVDAWLGRHFRPVSLMNEDYRDLIRAVREGMTLKQYLSGMAVAFAPPAARRVKAPRTETPTLPETPDDNLSVEQLAEYWKARCLGTEERMGRQIGELQRDLCVAQRKAALFEKELRRINSVLSKA